MVENSRQQMAEETSAKEIRKEFELYQANSKDQTYMSNWNNFEKRSISLIISKTSMREIQKSESNSPAKVSMAMNLRRSLTNNQNIKEHGDSSFTSQDINALGNLQQQLDDDYEAFDQSSELLPFQA